MNDRFKRALTVSTAVHAAVVLLVVIGPLFLHLLRHRKPKEMITIVDLMQALPEPPQMAEEQPKPAPEPEEIPEPPKPSVVPEVKPKPKPEPPKIKINTNRVILAKPPKMTTPPKTTIKPEDLKKILESGVKFTSVAGGSSGGEYSDFALVCTMVQQKMYEAWQQPATVPKGTTATISLRVMRSGAIVNSRMTRPSGDVQMDSSVMKAVQAVTRIKQPPVTSSDPYWDMTVDFVIDSSL